MILPDSGADASPRVRPAWRDPAILALGMVLPATSVIRLAIAPDRALWLDEVWTGMIVSRPSIAEFVRQCSYDINAPLYYIVSGVWVQIAGVSNLALRAPAMAFGVLGPLIALMPRRLLGRTTRLTWCVLLACWIPGLLLSLEARYYTLYFALGAANTIAFAALLKSPTQARAWIWAGVSTLMILSHYYGFILAGLQGLVYLAVCRTNAVRTWPAALAFLPAFASLGIHAARLVLFANPGQSWIPLMGVSDLIPAFGFMVGAAPTMLYVALWVVASLYFGAKADKARAAPREPAPADRHLWIAVACAVAAASLAMGFGFFKPMFIVRYLIGFTPGVLLGLALLAERFAAAWPRAPLFLVAAYFGVAAKLAITPVHNVTPFNFEAASHDLMAHTPRRLAFMWDNPTFPEESALQGVGGFFFARAGRPVDVTVVRAHPDQDPNIALLRQAAAPDTAILWIYDQSVSGTAAIRFPPHISAVDPRWQCRNYGQGALGVVACSRRR